MSVDPCIRLVGSRTRAALSLCQRRNPSPISVTAVAIETVQLNLMTGSKSKEIYLRGKEKGETKTFTPQFHVTRQDNARDYGPRYKASMSQHFFPHTFGVVMFHIANRQSLLSTPERLDYTSDILCLQMYIWIIPPTRFE